MMTRTPDLELDLAGAAHPSRSARKEVRRFLASRAIALVEDAGVAVTEVVRRIAQNRSDTISLRAWFDDGTSRLRIEILDGGGQLTLDGFTVLSALSTDWGAEPVTEGSAVWFEMQPREVHSRRGRIV
jgi:hypothetical protein